MSCDPLAESAPPKTVDTNAPAGDEPSTLSISFSKPLHYVILAILALYAPSAIGRVSFFEPDGQRFLFVGLVLGSFLISTTSLAWPLRYAYHNYGFLVKKANPVVSPATMKVTAWEPLPVLVLALLPWFRTWTFMGAIPLTWQFVRGEYQQAVSNVGNRVDEYCSKAEVAANKALSDAATAKQYERDMKQNLRTADFYDESSVGWMALNKFQTSGRRPPTVQGALITEAKAVVATTNDVAAQVAKALIAAQKALELLGEVRRLTASAKTAAREGRTADSERLVSDTEGKLGAVEEESEKVATAKAGAESHARDAYLAWLSVREQHGKQVAEVTTAVDKACIRAASVSALAQAELRAAEKHEHIAHTLVANVTRDARAAHNVRLPDFFRESAAAWVKLAGYVDAVKKAVDSTDTLNGVASDLKSKADLILDDVERGKIKNVAENCDEILNHVLNLKEDGEKTKENVDRFQQAAAQATKGRKMQAAAAADAVTTLAEITMDVQAAAEAASSATKRADETRQYAVDAKAAIALGSAEDAQVAIGKLKLVLTACEEELQITAQKRKDVQAKMAQFSTAKYIDVVADPDPVGRDITNTGEQDSDGGDNQE